MGEEMNPEEARKKHMSMGVQERYVVGKSRKTLAPEELEILRLREALKERNTELELAERRIRELKRINSRLRDQLEGHVIKIMEGA